MIKHSASHGGSVLLGIIIAAFLVEGLKPLFPRIYGWFENLSVIILAAIHVPMSQEDFTIVLFATILAIIWGIIFKARFVK